VILKSYGLSWSWPFRFLIEGGV